MMVESSYAGSQFQDVHWVPAKGKDGKGAEYEVILDDMPAGEYLLRLRMEDWDGSKEWSSIRSLRISSEDSWKVHASPEFIHISRQNFESRFSFKLFDLSGKLHRDLKMEGKENKLPLDDSFPSGMYFYIITDHTGKVFRSRLLLP